MSDIAIRVNNLSKVYRIGLNEQRHETLAGSVTSFLKSPLSNFRNLRKLSRFDSLDEEDVIWALRDVSFEVRHGEAVGIIGRNGAGKSTLLKILSRITEPSCGRAEVFGRVASLLEVGTGFHPDLTGRENVFLNGTILGMKKREIEKKFDAIVDFAGVEKFIDTPVKRYSSGMRVRLAFSVAAHLEPEILIIDEVLAVGDAAFQRKCLGKMSEVAGRGRTVLFVSHNMGAITSLCPTSICIEKGRVADRGDSQRVVASYLNRTSEEIANGGFADLRQAERHETLSDRHAQFDSVRTLNNEGKQSECFLEGQPIAINVAFTLSERVSDLQLGCGVRTCDAQLELFTVPSPEYRMSFQPGGYSARLLIDPNFLREGSYRLILKMFADGVRQDTIVDALQFSVVACHSDEELAARSQRWVAGPLRFDYAWEPPRSREESAARCVSQPNA